MLWNDPESLLAAALLALLLDAAAGDPPRIWQRLPHPVVIIGRMIAALERWLYVAEPPAAQWRGGVLAALVVLSAAACGAALEAVAHALPAGWLLIALAAAILFAWGSLERHVVAVACGLDQGLAAGRAAVRHIVGRDPEALDHHGVARAAIESLAENFSDGLMAPLFWLLLLGLPGLFAYKAINTLDSMLGYRNARYLYFGRASARLDDLANYLPARLTAVLFVAAAALLPDADRRQAVRVLRRDARRHRSPNAGYPEAALAGALGLRLSGPRRYGGIRCDEPWIGEGRAALEVADIYRALRFVRGAFLVLVAILIAGFCLLAAMA